MSLTRTDINVYLLWLSGRKNEPYILRDGASEGDIENMNLINDFVAEKLDEMIEYLGMLLNEGHKDVYRKSLDNLTRKEGESDNAYLIRMRPDPIARNIRISSYDHFFLAGLGKTGAKNVADQMKILLSY